MSDADQLKLQNAFTATIGKLEKTVLWPVQKESYMCSARCFDNIDTSESLQRCQQACQQNPQAASQIMQQEVNQVQQQIQRAMQVCQDKAQTVMRDGGSESKAKTAMESCAHGIIMENIAGLAGVDKRIRAGLKANNVI